MKIRAIMVAVAMAVSLTSFAQSIDGVSQLVVEDREGKELTAGTGFYVYSESLAKPVVLTSFHLLNSVLIDASKIIIKGNGRADIDLSILAYDELNDILVLSSTDTAATPFYFSDNCSSKFLVAGYHKGSFMTVGADTMLATKLREAKRLPVYLTKGFSGAPVFNQEAGICGMVVLSSEQNASSVAITAPALQRALKNTNGKGYDVRSLRLSMGVERVVRSQEELDQITSLKASGAQVVVMLSSETNNDFIIRDTDNVIIEADPSVNKIIVHNSKNIMLRDLSVSRLIINNSSQVSVSGSLFYRNSDPLLVKDSSNVMVTGCVFKNTRSGVVLKASLINEEQFINDNIFQSVAHAVSTI